MREFGPEGSSWLQKLPPSRSMPMAEMALVLLALSSGTMLAFAMPALVGNESVLDLIKSLVIAAAATVASYAVSRLAVEKGAPQAAIGMTGAPVVSVASILIVGFGLFASTYAGFTIRETDDLRLSDFGRELAVHVDQRGRSAAEAGRAAPVLDSIVEDLRVKEECERRSSCLSGHAHGGIGPVTRELADKRQRAETVLAQVNEGETARANAADQLAALLERYQDVVGDPEADRIERRKALQAIVADIGAQLSTLDEAVPTALLSAYAAELRIPVTIPDRREASAKITGMLQGYANSLGAALRSFDPGARQRPAFPGKTGVADTFGYLGHFLPIAAIVAVVELIFPLALWFYTLFSLQARVAREAPPDGPDDPEPESFSGLMSMKPVADVTPDAPRRRRSVKAD